MNNSTSVNAKFVSHTYIKQSIYSDNIKITGVVCVVASLIATIAALVFLSPAFVAIGLTLMGVSVIATAFTHCYVYVIKETKTRGEVFGPSLPRSSLDHSRDIIVELPRRSTSQMLQDAVVQQEVEAHPLENKLIEEYRETPKEPVEEMRNTTETVTQAASVVLDPIVEETKPIPAEPAKTQWRIFRWV